MFNDVHRLWAHGRVREVGQRCSEVEGRPNFLELKASFGVRIGSDRAQEFAEHSLALSWSPLAQQDFHMSRTYLEHVRYAGDLDKDLLHRRLHVLKSRTATARYPGRPGVSTPSALQASQAIHIYRYNID